MATLLPHACKRCDRYIPDNQWNKGRRVCDICKEVESLGNKRRNRIIPDRTNIVHSQTNYRLGIMGVSRAQAALQSSDSPEARKAFNDSIARPQGNSQLRRWCRRHGIVVE